MCVDKSDSISALFVLRGVVIHAAGQVARPMKEVYPRPVERDTQITSDGWPGVKAWETDRA